MIYLNKLKIVKKKINYIWSALNNYFYDRAAKIGGNEFTENELKNIRKKWDGYVAPKVLKVERDVYHRFLPIPNKQIHASGEVFYNFDQVEKTI